MTSTTFKQISLAVLVATFMAGSAVVAHAESGVGTAGTGSGFTSSALQSSAQANAPAISYGYASARGINRADRVAGKHGTRGRTMARAKNRNY